MSKISKKQKQTDTVHEEVINEVQRQTNVNFVENDMLIEMDVTDVANQEFPVDNDPETTSLNENQSANLRALITN